MINSQMPLEEKIKRADHVVWNNGDRCDAHGASEEACRALARAIMEEKLKSSTSRTETMEADVSTAHSQDSAEAPHSMGTRSNEERKLKTDLALDLNELQESSGEEARATGAGFGCLSAPRPLASSAYSRYSPSGISRRRYCHSRRFPRPGGRFVRYVALAEIELFTCP